MNKRLVKKFGDELDSLSISDYYGLKSPGLTCYLNSVLQVLFMTAGFRDAVKKSCCSENAMSSHLAELFYDLERKVTKTHHMVKMLDINDVYEQRDAAEYLEKILCRTSPEASKMFQGELYHNIRCLACDEENHSYSLFWILPIPMSDSKHKSYNVEEGLNTILQMQKFSSDNQLYCTRCRKKQDANIKCEIAQTPDVFTLLLKRFAFDHKQRRYAKLHCRAVVPKILDVKTCTYELYAVVHHCGSLSGGHYTADIRSFETGRWYCFDDDVVKSLKPQPFEGREDSLSSSTAYLLIYRKLSDKSEEPDGSDVEADCTQSDVQDEIRHNGAERPESPKLSNGILPGMSSDHPVNHRFGAVTRGAASQQENRKCFSQNTNKLKQERSCTREATQAGTKGQASAGLTSSQKYEKISKRKPWK